jgi:gamma-glutamylcyclotransferase (GGCT)/AIG2-like uncharacterized protein YtfP
MSDKQEEISEVLLFVYGTLQEGGRLHSQLGECRTSMVGVARILTKDFVMRDLITFPALQEVDSGSGTYIKGELYLVDKLTLANIDMLESCPMVYQRRMVTVWVDRKRFVAYVYYMGKDKPNTNALLSTSAVVSSGEWDAVRNRPMAGRAGFAEKPGHMTSEGEWTWNGDDDSAGDNVHSSYDDGTVDPNYGFVEGKDDVDAASDFDVEPGVYISNEHGDFWGPFDNIEHACRAMMEIQVDCVTNVLTIGFRMVRKDVTEDVMVDIEAMTTHMEVL